MKNKIKNQTILRASALFWITFFLSNSTLSQQNLIVNPDFEILSNSPLTWTEWGLSGSMPYPITDEGWESICMTVEWFQDQETYVYNPDVSPVAYSTPCPYSECATAHNGHVFTGMIPVWYQRAFQDEDQRDIMRGTFTSPLIAGKSYRIKFYVNVFDGNCRIKEIPISLSNNLDHENMSALQVSDVLSPQHLEMKSFLNDNIAAMCTYDYNAPKNTWVPATATFTAQGGERYFYIHFYNLPINEPQNPAHEHMVIDSGIDTLNEIDVQAIAQYLLFDDFSLTEKPFFPNVITTDTDSLNSNFHYSDITVPCHVSIYNRWGTEIAAITPENPYFYSTNPGTYYYTGTCDKWEEKGYFEIITK
jgi:hypothetical protein